MKKAIKIIAFILAGALIVSSLFIVRACSAPPEYSEIRERVEYLINASYDVNDIVWGEGLETYERVYDPKSSLEIFETGNTYEDENGEEKALNYYFYLTLNEKYKVFAYRKQHDTKADYTYAYLSDKKVSVDELKKLFPKEKEHADNELYYTSVLSDEETSRYAYCVPFTEPKYDFYYTKSDPEDYDYVLLDSKYGSADAIKAYIRTVYSEKYADSLDSTLFDGVLEGEFVSKARYTTQFNYRLGGDVLVKLNAYEPKFEERRVYLFDTAKINRNSSNKDEVLVEIDSYLPSDPDKKVVAKIYFALQDGEWFLSTPTY